VVLDGGNGQVTCIGATAPHAVVDFVPRLASMTQNLITGMLVDSRAEVTSKTGKTDP
jgi:hypothetical protein